MAGILAYGSSTTQGHGDSLGGWPVRLQESLRVHTGNQYFEVVNYGFRCTLSSDILADLPHDVRRFHRSTVRLGIKPSKLFAMVQFASDSSIRDKENRVEFTPPAHFKKNIREIGAFCLEVLDSPPLIVTMPPLIDGLARKQYLSGYNHPGREEYNQYCREVAQQEGYPLADVEQTFIRAIEGNNPADFFIDDGFHPNSMGHILIKDTVLPVALELIDDTGLKTG